MGGLSFVPLSRTKTKPLFRRLIKLRWTHNSKMDTPLRCSIAKSILNWCAAEPCCEQSDKFKKKTTKKNTRMGIEGGEKQKSEKERDVGGGGLRI